MKKWIRIDWASYVVDQKEYDEVLKKAELNEGEIEERAQKLYLDYLATKGIDINITVHGVEDICLHHHSIIDSTYNYMMNGETQRNYTARLKDAVVDDIVWSVKNELGDVSNDILKSCQYFKTVVLQGNHKLIWRLLIYSICVTLILIAYVLLDILLTK